MEHKTEYEEVDLVRHGLKLIWNIFFSVWLFGTWITEECLENDDQTCVCLWWIRQFVEHPMYVDCVSTVFTVRRERIFKKDLISVFYIIIIVLKQQAAYWMIKLVKLKYTYLYLSNESCLNYRV